MQNLSRTLVILSCGFTLLACTVVTDPSSSSRSTSGGESAPATALNKHQQISAFVAANFSRLKEDMAAGQGEYLTSLATLLDVQPAQQADFFAFTQEHFALLFSAEDTTADQLLANLYRQLAAQPQFSRLVAQN